eukprot:10980285-Alexandrium_andersonii.AAC.1
MADGPIRRLVSALAFRFFAMRSTRSFFRMGARCITRAITLTVLFRAARGCRESTVLGSPKFPSRRIS